MRRFGSAVLLGLPAALFAHVLVFGSDHVVGGSMHAAVLELGGVFAFLTALMAASAAVRSRCAAAPRFLTIVAGAAAWFAAIELCERSHGTPFLLTALAIVFASWLVRAILLAFAQTVAAIAVILAGVRVRAPRIAFAHRANIVLPRSAAHRLRLFSRPPPVFS